MMATRRSDTGLRGLLKRNELLSKHTSWRVGGPADRFYEPADIQDLAEFLSTLPPNEPLHWIGLGSNLLVRDSGIRGTVIMLSGKLNGLERLDPHTVRAEAGVASAKLARFSVQQELRGAEFLAGVPGTVGGALAMNAGAFGGETWNVVSAVETMDCSGRVRVRQASDYQTGYRSVQGPANEWFIAGHFRLTAGNPADATAERRLSVPQSTRRLQRTFDRAYRSERFLHRRRLRLRAARQFHYQHRQGHGRGHRSPDRIGA